MRHCSAVKYPDSLSSSTLIIYLTTLYHQLKFFNNDRTWPIALISQCKLCMVLNAEISGSSPDFSMNM